MSRRALFVVSTRGQGHIVRCRALASELLTRGILSTMTDRSPLSATSFDVSIIDLGSEEHEIAVAAALRDRPVVAIVDTPHAIPADVVVCGSAGATNEMFPLDHPNWQSGKGRPVRLASGPGAALLRPEFLERRERLQRCFAHLSLRDPVPLDLRSVENMSADEIAGALFSSVACGDPVITYGGMRAMEAACVRFGAEGMTIEARNPGEELNKAGLLADPERDLVDGRGCIRIGEIIQELVA